MYLNVSKKKDGRTYLSISKNYRDKNTGKTRTKSVQSIGYVDILKEEYADPIAHFKEVARQMTALEKKEKSVTLALSIDEDILPDTDNRKNYGYAALMKIYHELLLHEFLAAKARYQKFKFNTNSIMLLLVISRILSPGSKKKAFDEKGRYFERFDFELADVYRALSHFAGIGAATQKFLNEQITKQYGRDTSIIYFDSTNFYFEIDNQDYLRRRGVSKERRPNPIVQMGLAMDRDGIPISYDIFPGNKHDSETFRNVIGKICKNYGTGRIIAVGDMGIITADNIWYLIGGKPHKPRHGYVFSYSVRKASGKFQQYVLSDDGYVNRKGEPASDEDNYKIKSRRIARGIDVHFGTEGKTKKKNIYEKQVVFWNKKYADKSKAEREIMLAKAQIFIKNPEKYKKHTGHGSAKYINGIDKDTGEINPSQILSINYELVAEEEKYDGYYAIVTSESDMSEEQIIATYRGLWEIEESFRITKGDLEARPVFVSRQDRIEAHFLTCFIALVIVRLLQKKTNHDFSVGRIIDTLNRISCSNIQDNLYLFD
ncbi:MAG: IS1634 family transposase, partial [Clostridiales Family XIII bacterium]|nr:IS1634 family transposase [Clostridiales Family XIII bacterium]